EEAHPDELLRDDLVVHREDVLADEGRRLGVDVLLAHDQCSPPACSCSGARGASTVLGACSLLYVSQSHPQCAATSVASKLRLASATAVEYHASNSFGV